MLQRKACPLNRLHLPTPMSTLTPHGSQQLAKLCHGTMSQGIHFWKALTSSLSMQIYSTFIILAQAETWLTQHWFTCWRGGESLKARILQLAWPQLLLNYDASARKENCRLSSTNFREASLLGTLLICQNCDLLGMTPTWSTSGWLRSRRVTVRSSRRSFAQPCGQRIKSYPPLQKLVGGCLLRSKNSRNAMVPSLCDLMWNWRTQAWNVAEGLTGCVPNCICGITF